MSEVNADEFHSFGVLLANLEDGQLNQDISDQITDMVARIHDAYRDQGGKPAGKLTLSIGFKLDGGVIEAAATFKVEMPKEARPKTILWATRGNKLTRSNPRQQELGLNKLRTVTGPGAARTV
jgi:hypothetical protein